MRFAPLLQIYPTQVLPFASQLIIGKLTLEFSDSRLMEVYFSQTGIGRGNGLPDNCVVATF